MDGRRSVQDLWQLGQRQLEEDAPTQDEIIQLLGQLHAADLLVTDSDANVLEVFERGERTSASRRRRMWANPMAVRIPLWDPGSFLDRHVPQWRWLWGRAGGLLWLASTDLRKYHAVLNYLGFATLFLGATLCVVDWVEGLPKFWALWEGPFDMVLGGVMLYLNRRAAS